MGSKLEKDKLMFTDALGKSAGLQFDGVNYKAADSAGNLVGVSVKYPETEDEALNASALSKIHILTSDAAISASWANGVITVDPGSFNAAVTDDCNKIKSNMRDNERCFFAQLRLALELRSEPPTVVGSFTTLSMSNPWWWLIPSALSLGAPPTSGSSNDYLFNMTGIDDPPNCRNFQIVLQSDVAVNILQCHIGIVAFIVPTL